MLQACLERLHELLCCITQDDLQPAPSAAEQAPPHRRLLYWMPISCFGFPDFAPVAVEHNDPAARMAYLCGLCEEHDSSVPSSRRSSSSTRSSVS